MDKQFGACKSNTWNGITIATTIDNGADVSVTGTDLEEDDEEEDGGYVPL